MAKLLNRLTYKWLAVLAFASVWTAAWALAWNAFLLNTLYRQPAAGVLVFNRMEGDLRILWWASVVGFSLTIVGVAMFRLHGSFKRDSPLWGRFWLVAGGAVALFGIALPVITPSTQSLLADEHARVVSLERRWLVTAQAHTLGFDEIGKLNLRIERRTVGVGEDQACKTGLGFSIVSKDLETVIKVPPEFADRAIAEKIAAVAGVPLEERGRREC